MSGGGISNTNMADESGEIILKTQGDSEEDEATSATACSGRVWMLSYRLRTR